MSYNAVPPPASGSSGGAGAPKVDFAAALNKAKEIAAKLGKAGGDDGAKRARSQEPDGDGPSAKRERYDEQPRTAGAPKYGLGSEERRDRDSASNPFASLPAHIQEEIHVPNSVVGTDSAEDRLDTAGMIIGRGGENLKRIENESRARVQFEPAGGPGEIDRRVTISGTPENVKVAKEMINKVVEEEMGRKTARTAPQVAQPYSSSGIADYSALLQTGGVGAPRPSRPDVGPSSQVFSMSVPKNCVGQIIGRGGETVRELSSRSGARIDVTPEHMADPMSMERQVTIQGTQDAIDRARALIDDIVNGMPSRGGYGGGGGGGDGYGGGGGYGGDQRQTEIVEVPSSYVGSIIGRGGSEIKALEREAGCRIMVAPPGTGGPTRQVTLTGAPDRVAYAKKLIDDRIADAASNGGRSSSYGKDSGGGYGQQQGGGGGYGGQQQGYGAQDPYYGAYGAPQAQAYDPAYSMAFYSDPKNVEAYWTWFSQTYPEQYAGMIAAQQAAAAAGAQGAPAPPMDGGRPPAS